MEHRLVDPSSGPGERSCDDYKRGDCSKAQEAAVACTAGRSPDDIVETGSSMPPTSSTPSRPVLRVLCVASYVDAAIGEVVTDTAGPAAADLSLSAALPTSHAPAAADAAEPEPDDDSTEQFTTISADTSYMFGDKTVMPADTRRPLPMRPQPPDVPYCASSAEAVQPSGTVFLSDEDDEASSVAARVDTTDKFSPDASDWEECSIGHSADSPGCMRTSSCADEDDEDVVDVSINCPRSAKSGLADAAGGRIRAQILEYQPTGGSVVLPVQVRLRFPGGGPYEWTTSFELSKARITAQQRNLALNFYLRDSAGTATEQRGDVFFSTTYLEQQLLELEEDPDPKKREKLHFTHKKGCVVELAASSLHEWTVLDRERYFTRVLASMCSPMKAAGSAHSNRQTVNSGRGDCVQEPAVFCQDLYLPVKQHPKLSAALMGQLQNLIEYVSGRFPHIAGSRLHKVFCPQLGVIILRCGVCGCCGADGYITVLDVHRDEAPEELPADFLHNAYCIHWRQAHRDITSTDRQGHRQAHHEASASVEIENSTSADTADSADEAAQAERTNSLCDVVAALALEEGKGGPELSTMPNQETLQSASIVNVSPAAANADSVDELEGGGKAALPAGPSRSLCSDASLGCHGAATTTESAAPSCSAIRDSSGLPKSKKRVTMTGPARLFTFPRQPQNELDALFHTGAEEDSRQIARDQERAVWKSFKTDCSFDSFYLFVLWVLELGAGARDMVLREFPNRANRGHYSADFHIVALRHLDVYFDQMLTLFRSYKREGHLDRDDANRDASAQIQARIVGSVNACLCTLKKLGYSKRWTCRVLAVFLRLATEDRAKVLNSGRVLELVQLLWRPEATSEPGRRPSRNRRVKQALAGDMRETEDGALYEGGDDGADDEDEQREEQGGYYMALEGEEHVQDEEVLQEISEEVPEEVLSDEQDEPTKGSDADNGDQQLGGADEVVLEDPLALMELLEGLGIGSTGPIAPTGLHKRLISALQRLKWEPETRELAEDCLKILNVLTPRIITERNAVAAAEGEEEQRDSFASVSQMHFEEAPATAPKHTLKPAAASTVKQVLDRAKEWYRTQKGKGPALWELVDLLSEQPALKEYSSCQLQNALKNGDQNKTKAAVQARAAVIAFLTTLTTAPS